MMGMILLLVLMLLMPGCGSKHDQEHKSHEKSEVHLSLESQQLIGLELVKVQKKPLESSIEVTGEIAKETENVAHITSPVSGTFKSYLAKSGEGIEKDSPACVIQKENGDSLELPSPLRGIVLAEYLKPADPVDNLTSIMTIANTDFLRASFDVYEKDIAGIKTGQKMVVKSIAFPGKIFNAEIVFISPSVDEKTRTIKIGANIKNEERLLKFGMFVTGEILIPISEEVLTIPVDAIQKIEGETVVFVPEKEEGKSVFKILKVRLGRQTADYVEVAAGLSEGEEVVEKGSFYLKSELLKGELEKEEND